MSRSMRLSALADGLFAVPATADRDIRVVLQGNSSGVAAGIIAAAQGLRDPFSAPIATRDGSGSGPRPDPDRRKEVLEAFPLDSLNMVGTMDSGQGVVGLIMAPDRVTYRVRPNNYLGQNEGRITGVFEDRIELVELLPDGAGGWLERQARIALDSQ